MNRKPHIFLGEGRSAGRPATRGTPEQTLSAIMGDAFGGSSSVTLSGDWLVQNTFDGFDRKIDSTDAAGGMVLNTFDPGGRPIASQTLGSPGGPTPTDRSGSANVLLASSEARFDEAGRRYETQRDVFLEAAYYGAGPAGLPSGRTVTHTGGGLAANSTTNNTGTFEILFNNCSMNACNLLASGSASPTSSRFPNRLVQYAANEGWSCFWGKTKMNDKGRTTVSVGPAWKSWPKQK